MGSSLDYIQMLCALRDIPFPVGKKLLAAFLRGDEDHDSITNHRLSELPSFASLGGYTPPEIDEMFDSLLFNGLIEPASLPGKKFWKVFQLSPTGRAEIEHPTLHTKKIVTSYAFQSSPITEKDHELFHAFEFFLNPYNDEQKKAITSVAHQILCVAGAGSGKTTTLTKRIEFLVRYRSVNPAKLLAITFTRKARQEMEQRLHAASVHGVHVETFNSFCEKILQAYNNLIYEKFTHVISFSDKLRLLHRALESTKTSLRDAVHLYYSPSQERGKSDDELAFGLMNDCFTILEYYKNEEKELEDFSLKPGLIFTDRIRARLVYNICRFLSDSMVREGLRDYTDQLVDALRFFALHPEHIPSYDHILVDEYQDINSSQMKLIDVLRSPNIFCVGDPRQSIFGWRGSKVRHILDFQKKYPASEVVTLVKNYRSHHHIVGLMNASIQCMRLPDLESASDGTGEIALLSFEHEAAEYAFVLQKILEVPVSRENIFVLARTHRQLQELSHQLSLRNILHAVRSDERRTAETPVAGAVTLATVHAIKGMEADCVFVIGCHGANFPCKASDHPIIDLVKEVEYDKEEEERRLFYVALSRSRKHLYITHSGVLTKFVTPSMKNLLVLSVPIQESPPVSPVLSIKTGPGERGDTFERLKLWRKALAQRLNVPAYIVFHDSTLLEIALRKPENLDELAEIKGVGPAKLAKHGEEVLSVVLGR